MTTKEIYKAALEEKKVCYRCVEYRISSVELIPFRQKFKVMVKLLNTDGKSIIVCKPEDVFPNK